MCNPFGGSFGSTVWKDIAAAGSFDTGPALLACHLFTAVVGRRPNAGMVGFGYIAHHLQQKGHSRQNNEMLHKIDTLLNRKNK